MSSYINTDNSSSAYCIPTSIISSLKDRGEYEYIKFRNNDSSDQNIPYLVFTFTYVELPHIDYDMLYPMYFHCYTTGIPVSLKVSFTDDRGIIHDNYIFYMHNDLKGGVTAKLCLKEGAYRENGLVEDLEIPYFYGENQIKSDLSVWFEKLMCFTFYEGDCSNVYLI